MLATTTIELSATAPIIPAMRHFLLALMIVLLPVRGWIGDAMAIGMQSQPLNAMQTIAQSSGSERAEGTFHDESGQKLVDCHGHAGMASAATDASPSPNLAAGDGCGDCTSCDVCHSIAFTATALPSALTALPPARPGIGGSHFTSAERASSLKPPIS